jgi:hypothetical protein
VRPLFVRIFVSFVLANFTVVFVSNFGNKVYSAETKTRHNPNWFRTSDVLLSRGFYKLD